MSITFDPAKDAVNVAKHGISLGSSGSLTAMKQKLIRPTDAENAAITAAALSDPDNMPLANDELAQFKRLPGRPRAESPKVFTGIRLDADVVDAFRASGKGWQTRMNDALRDWLKTHSPV